MAADRFRVLSHERSDRLKYMEHSIARYGEPESIMKFSSQQIESPPPKPPRRRYSDQLSVPSLGTYSSNKKHNEETQRSELKLKRCSPKPAYLSLPANLTANVVTECNDSPNLFLHSNRSDQIKHSKNSDFYAKNFLGDSKLSDSSVKTFSANQFCNTEKLYTINQGLCNDHVLLKYQYDNCIPHITDKFLKNSINKAEIPVTKQTDSLKPVYKDCHRRHHSDPIISHFNLQKDNLVKFDCELCCDNLPCSHKIFNSYCDSMGNCSCCKKSYLIMQEIKILKEINEKLWQHLCSVQSSLENMKRKDHSECSDVSVSDLLSSIYYAQKAKDSAMEERLKIVLEERDTTLHELDDLIQVLTKSYDYSDVEKEIGKDMKELLSEIRCTSNPSKLLKYQRMLLAHIHNLKSVKQDCLLLELRQAKIERDNAIEKVKKMEADVRDLKICYDLWHSDNQHWEVTIFDILNEVMHQRDTVLSKTDNGFDIGSIIYSRSAMPSKFDLMEQQSVSAFEPRSKTIESLKSHQSVHTNDYRQSMGSSDEVKQLKEEILLLNKTLENERKKREQYEGKCLKFERLVHILRKKLNGQNIGVLV